MGVVKLKQGEGTPFDQLVARGNSRPLSAVPAPPVPSGDATLAELAAIANAAHESVYAAGRQLVGHAIRAGEALLKAQEIVPDGEWIDWMAANVRMHVTTAYRYMRIAEHKAVVLDADVDSIGAALRLLADRPRRGHGPLRYSPDDVADMVALAKRVGIKPAATALGVSPSTVHKFVGKLSEDSERPQRRLVSQQITEDRIERVADWLVARFGPDSFSTDARVDAAELLQVVFEKGC